MHFFYLFVPKKNQTFEKTYGGTVPGIQSETDRIFCHFAPFFPFYPTNKPQNQDFQKEKKNDLEMSTFYTCLPKIMIIWCMLPEISSTTDIFFCHFMPFFALFTPLTTMKTKIWKNITNSWRYYPFTHMHHIWRWYDEWFLRYKTWQTERFLSFWVIFRPLTLLTTRKIKIWKNEKKSGNIIILHMCTINENHMTNGSWDMEHNRQIFLSIWPFLCHFVSFFALLPH